MEGIWNPDSSLICTNCCAEPCRCGQPTPESARRDAIIAARQAVIDAAKAWAKVREEDDGTLAYIGALEKSDLLAAVRALREVEG